MLFDDFRAITTACGYGSLLSQERRHNLAFPRRRAPRSCIIFPPKQEGVGNAGCPLHPWVPCKKSTGVGPQVHRNHPAFPHADGFNGFLRDLPGDRLVDTVTGEVTSANLTPAPRRQDHTTSPSAKACRKKLSRRCWYRPAEVSCEDRSAPLVLRRRRVHRIPFLRP